MINCILTHGQHICHYIRCVSVVGASRSVCYPSNLNSVMCCKDMSAVMQTSQLYVLLLQIAFFQLYGQSFVTVWLACLDDVHIIRSNPTWALDWLAFTLIPNDTTLLLDDVTQPTWLLEFWHYVLLFPLLYLRLDASIKTSTQAWSL